MAQVEDTLAAELPVEDEAAIIAAESPSEQPPLPILSPDLADVEAWAPPGGERWVRWGLIGCLCLLFLPNLGSFGLWDPWETHYGAVTTEMLDTYDWISPWWGYRGQIGEKTQGNYFYSKPVFIFWTEAVAARSIGRGEWAVRLPVALLAMLAVFIAYLTISKIWTRRVGLISALVLATSPQFFMISRQAQTDMPFVATLLIAFCFLMMALFGPREPMSDRRFKRWGLFTLGFVLLNSVPQYLLIMNDLSVDSDATFHKGIVQGLIWFVLLGGILWWFLHDYRKELREHGMSAAFKDRWLRKFYLVGFYVFVAQSTYAKGGLGFLLPGAVVLTYLIVSKNWWVLARAELLRGIGFFICIGLPWYIAMFSRHGGIGGPYWTRWIVHDHLKRFGTGVHQIDSGTFEHFIKWLGVGTFPWVAFVPLALLWLFTLRARDNSRKNQALVFVASWFMLSFVLFTLSSTKFHHYIFPAMPALAIITALYLVHVMKVGAWMARGTALIGIVVFFAVGWDIHEDPQQIRNLMTYKYDRPMPSHLPLDADAKVATNSEVTWDDSYFYKHTSETLQSILQADFLEYEGFIEFLLIFGLIALTLFFVARTRKAALVALGLLSAMLAAWSLNYYMPSLTPHWSQKYLFDAYYDTCTPQQLPAEAVAHLESAYRPWIAEVGLDGVADFFRSEPKRICEEDVISWLITWRGETYYSYNEIKPIEKKDQFLPYLRDYNLGHKFYVLIERGKHSGFKADLKNHTKTLANEGLAGFKGIKDWTVAVENDENQFFQMVSATPKR